MRESVSTKLYPNAAFGLVGQFNLHFYPSPNFHVRVAPEKFEWYWKASIIYAFYTAALAP